MKVEEPQEVEVRACARESEPDALFNELELPERTRKPPGGKLIKRLNEMITKPPFCWIKKYKDGMPSGPRHLFFMTGSGPFLLFILNYYLCAITLSL